MIARDSLHEKRQLRPTLAWSLGILLRATYFALPLLLKLGSFVRLDIIAHTVGESPSEAAAIAKRF